MLAYSIEFPSKKCSKLASSYVQYEGFQISKGRTKVA
nr:MAG TPA: hypothetical protein [Caudoviricetes sp.]